GFHARQRELGGMKERVAEAPGSEVHRDSVDEADGAAADRRQRGADCAGVHGRVAGVPNAIPISVFLTRIRDPGAVVGRIGYFVRIGVVRGGGDELLPAWDPARAIVIGGADTLLSMAGADTRVCTGAFADAATPARSVTPRSDGRVARNPQVLDTAAGAREDLRPDRPARARAREGTDQSLESLVGRAAGRRRVGPRHGGFLAIRVLRAGRQQLLE